MAPRRPAADGGRPRTADSDRPRRGFSGGDDRPAPVRGGDSDRPRRLPVAAVTARAGTSAAVSRPRRGFSGGDRPPPAASDRRRRLRRSSDRGRDRRLAVTGPAAATSAATGGRGGDRPRWQGGDRDRRRPGPWPRHGRRTGATQRRPDGGDRRSSVRGDAGTADRREGGFRRDGDDRRPGGYRSGSGPGAGLRPAVLRPFGRRQDRPARGQGFSRAMSDRIGGVVPR